MGDVLQMARRPGTHAATPEQRRAAQETIDMIEGDTPAPRFAKLLSQDELNARTQDGPPIVGVILIFAAVVIGLGVVAWFSLMAAVGAACFLSGYAVRCCFLDMGWASDMTVHHLSAPDKAALVAQIAAITEAAGEAAWRVQMLHPTGAGYKAIVTVGARHEQS